jgi:hypothetical protein
MPPAISCFHMKYFFLPMFLLTALPPARGQAWFEAEGKKELTGSIERQYSFFFNPGNRLTLSLLDSTLKYENKQHTVIKECRFYVGQQRKTTDISYLDKDGHVYKSKYYDNDTLALLTENKYDAVGRIILSTKQNFRTHTTERKRKSFKDSLSPTGQKWIIENRREETADGHKYINEFRYSANIETSTTGTLAYSNSPCFGVVPYNFSTTDYATIRKIAMQLLADNNKKLDGKSCPDFILTMVSPDHQQTRLSLIKRRPYWCEGQRIYFFTRTIF